jgi:hypothetical protein
MDFVIEDEQTQPAMVERDIVPAGIHRMTVRHCEEGPNQYKTSDENPDGQCIKLRLATVDGQYKFVFDDIPQHLGWRAKQLAEAVAILPASGRLSLQPDELVGQVVNVEISHYTSKAGKVSAVVKRYVPSSAVAAATPKPAIKPKPQKVAAVGPADDIPF